MKYRKLRCLTRIPTTDDVKPAFRWRISNQYIDGFTYEAAKHRIPSFLSLHAHLTIEETLENLAIKLIPKPFSKITLLLYDIIHGFLCAYTMQEIITFWKDRTHMEKTVQRNTTFGDIRLSPKCFESI